MKRFQNNSDEELHHVNLDGLQIMKQLFSDGSWSFFIRVIMLVSCLNEAYSGFDQKRVQDSRSHLHRSSPRYTGIKVFEFCYFNPNDFASMEIRLAYSLPEPCGKFFKSNDYTKKHLQVVVGQWNPSSSEDG
jgi:hypothetical protein